MKNKDIIQSYIVTIARYNYTVYEKRILYSIVASLQYQLEGQKLNATFKKLEFCGCTQITIPIKNMLLSPTDKNHKRLKEALIKLSDKKFEIQNGRNWKLCRVIEKPEITKNGEIMQFEMHKELFDEILNFTKGYRKYELKTILELKSTHSMRLYEIISEQKNPITYSIYDLKDYLQLTEKYKQNKDFIKRIIEPAKKELDKKSPYSFEYKFNEGYKKTHITLIPKKKTENQDQELETKRLYKKINTSFIIDRTIIKYLKDNYQFTEDEIKNNGKLFNQCGQTFDLIKTLSDIKRTASEKKNPKGWIINTLKGKLKDILKTQEKTITKPTLNKIKNEQPITDTKNLLENLVKLKTI